MLPVKFFSFYKITSADSGSGDSISALSPFERWRADSGITLNSDRVSTWTGMVGSRLLTQATASAQPFYSSSAPLINNKPSIAFQTNDYLIADSSPEDWKFMHDGTGVEGYIIYVTRQTNTGSATNQVLFTTAGTSIGASSLGTSFTIQPNLQNQNYRIGNGTNAVVTSVLMTASVDLAILGRFGYQEGLATEFSHSLNANSVTGNSANAPSSTAAFTLTLGRLAAAATNFAADQEIAELCIWNRRLTQSEIETVKSYVQTQYGIVVP